MLSMLSKISLRKDTKPQRCRRSQRRAGQVIVIGALSMVVLLGFIGLAIDGGNLYATRRQMQNASDAGAFAGARLLGSRGRNSEVLADVVSYAGRNYVNTAQAGNVQAFYKDANDLLIGAVPNNMGWPPSNARAVEVVTTRQNPTYFIRVLGITETQVQAISAARATPQTQGGYAIWAQESGRPSGDKVIDISGSSSTITGKIHTNSGFYVGGSSNTVKDSTIEHFTGIQVSGGLRETNTTRVPLTGDYPPFPVDWSIGEFRPGGDEALAAGSAYVNVPAGTPLSNYYLPGTKTIRPGLYYSTGKIDVSDSNVIADNVSFVSEQDIIFGGSDNKFTPFIRVAGRGDLLAFSDKAPSADNRFNEAVINVGGSNVSYQGQLFAPRGAIGCSGSINPTIMGSLIAMGVLLNGSNLTINAGANTAPSPPQILLYK